MTCGGCGCVFLTSLHPTHPSFGHPAKAVTFCPSCGSKATASEFGAYFTKDWDKGLRHFLADVARQQAAISQEKN